jgi:hypothetical protein
MPQRLELLGRYSLDPFTSGGIDASEIGDCVAPFLQDALADPDGFLTNLHTLIAADRGGFATFGAARLVWELYGDQALRTPAAWPLIDAGIDFKRARPADHELHWLRDAAADPTSRHPQLTIELRPRRHFAVR